MTREEEIDQAIQHWSEYYGLEFTAEAGNALAKVILARNEELQRRVDALTGAVKRCLPHVRSRVAYFGDTEAGEDYRPYKEAKADCMALLTALDAKEQDDD